jgi:2-C-methyl-D-erythritol 4-phosphate cytidylyltransferase
MWMAQTPQLAMRDDLDGAHERALADGFEGTDDAMLLERIGVEVVAVASSGENFKITTPGDLLRASVLPEVAHAPVRRLG